MKPPNPTSDIEDILYARRAVEQRRARKIREDAGLSRRSIANALGVSDQSIVNWENQAPISDTYAAAYGALLRRLENQTEHTESEQQ